MYSLDHDGYVPDCQNSEFIEIGCNNLGVAIGNEGILHRTVDYENGFNLDHRIGTNATVDLIKQTAPAFVWVSLPGERLCKVTGEWSPTAWRNYERLRRRDLQRSAEVADGIVKVMANGGHFAWEWDKRAHFGWKGRAIEKIRKAAEECDRMPRGCVSLCSGRGDTDLQELENPDFEQAAVPQDDEKVLPRPQTPRAYELLAGAISGEDG